MVVLSVLLVFVWREVKSHQHFWCDFRREEHARSTLPQPFCLLLAMCMHAAAS